MSCLCPIPDPCRDSNFGGCKTNFLQTCSHPSSLEPWYWGHMALREQLLHGFLAWAGALSLNPAFLLVSQKLTVPTGLSVTSPHKRTWFIPPLGSARPFPPWMMVAAAVPALLVLILIFMETQITA